MANLSPTNTQRGALSPTNNAGSGGGRLLKTRQLTCYAVGDDGDYEAGLPASYTVLTTGQFAGTTAIDTPHYANNGISFVAPSTINDAGAGFVTFLATDTIRVRGSALNDGVYTIAVGAVAGSIVVNELTIVNEGAGRYVTICKRSTPSNNCVIDNITGLMWKRASSTTVGSVERIGNTSVGYLNWYDVANTYALHPAAADLQMMTTGIKIVGGNAELPRYFAGMIIICTGFANAVNNLPGYRITSVTVNGADLDIILWTGKNTLIAEAAAGARTISIVCRSIFSYAAAANSIVYVGYSDWRIPNIPEWITLWDYEAPSAAPNTIAFPNWPGDGWWTATTRPSTTTNAMFADDQAGGVNIAIKTGLTGVELVRG